MTRIYYKDNEDKLHYLDVDPFVFSPIVDEYFGGTGYGSFWLESPPSGYISNINALVKILEKYERKLFEKSMDKALNEPTT